MEHEDFKDLCDALTHTEGPKHLEYLSIGGLSNTSSVSVCVWVSRMILIGSTLHLDGLVHIRDAFVHPNGPQYLASLFIEFRNVHIDTNIHHATCALF